MDKNSDMPSIYGMFRIFLDQITNSSIACLSLQLPLLSLKLGNKQH